jgi:TonB family protein
MAGISTRTMGILGTILIHGLIILLLVLFGFTTPLPLPAERGILINFGNSEVGSGPIEPKIEAQSVPQKPAESKTIEEATPLTQDNEEAPALPVEKKKEVKITEVKKPEPQKQPQTEEVKKTEQAQPAEAEKPREANKKALFPGQKKDGGTTGEGETDKQGNQGAEEGSPDSKNRTGSTGGGGDSDWGILANLNGRKDLSLPKPEYTTQKEATVIVRVTVDRQGNVTKAESGVKGSTTLDSQLLEAARKAAMDAKFDVNANAPAFQIGTITYKFRYGTKTDNR